MGGRFAPEAREAHLAQLVELVARDGPIGLNELLAEVPYSRPVAVRYLKQLESAGRVKSRIERREHPRLWRVSYRVRVYFAPEPNEEAPS